MSSVPKFTLASNTWLADRTYRKVNVNNPSKSKFFQKATKIGLLNLQDALGNLAAVLQMTTVGRLRYPDNKKIGLCDCSLISKFCNQTDLNESEQQEILKGMAAVE